MWVEHYGIALWIENSGIAQWVEHHGIAQWVEYYGIVYFPLQDSTDHTVIVTRKQTHRPEAFFTYLRADRIGAEFLRASLACVSNKVIL